MRATLLSCGALALLSLGCGQTELESDTDGLQIIVAPLSAEDCAVSENGNRRFPPDVNELRVRIRGGSVDFATKLTKDMIDASGVILMEHVPPGDDLTMDVFGCIGSEVAWSGRATIDVHANEKTAPRLVFMKKNSYSCTGNTTEAGNAQFESEMTQARAFHQAVPIVDGNILLVGGFIGYGPLKTAVLLATDADQIFSITEYDSSRSVFRNWRDSSGARIGLHSPRGWHHAVAFNSGQHVLVAGGVHRAALQPAPDPPISLSPEDGDPLGGRPANVVEIIDVRARTVKAIPAGAKLEFEALPGSAMAANGDGTTIVISGGALTNGAPSNSLERVVGSVDTLISGEAQVVDRLLTTARLGHTATMFGAGHVLMLAGNFDGGAADIAEVVQADPFESVKVKIVGGAAIDPYGFHQTALLKSDDCRHTFLSFGGMGLARDSQQNPVYISASKDPSRVLLFQLDRCDPKNPEGSFVDQSGSFDKVRVRRIFHSLTDLGGGLLMVGGGFNQLFKPDPASTFCYPGDPEKGETYDQFGCFLADTLILAVDTSVDVAIKPSGIEDLNFSRARFGHSATLLADDTVLTAGGVLAVGGPPDKAANYVVGDAEIYNPSRQEDADICK